MQHKHSFKMLHHRHTSYPLLACLLLLTGIFCVAWTGWVNGESYSVNAVIPAAPLTAPATILSPHANDIVNIAQITVSGQCPAHSYVKLFTNNVFSGVSLCQDNNWQMSTMLAAGSNTLVAQDYNVTDQPGPASSSVHVIYRAASTATSATVSPPRVINGSSNTVSANSNPLVLGSDYTYVGYNVDELSHWPLTINGGIGPYAVRVDWGDGNSDLKSLATAGAFDLQHAYSQAGGYQNSYTIKITATDTNGVVGVLQLLTIISPGGTGNGAWTRTVTSSSLPTANPLLHAFFRIVTPIYAVTFVGLASFWLGQHREFALARQRAVKIHKRKPMR